MLYIPPMSQITNLNRFRKQKARADKRAAADVNAVKFGRTKVQKSLEQAQTEKNEADFEAHKRDPN